MADAHPGQAPLQRPRAPPGALADVHKAGVARIERRGVPEARRELIVVRGRAAEQQTGERRLADLDRLGVDTSALRSSAESSLRMWGRAQGPLPRRSPLRGPCSRACVFARRVQH
ncbi:hypothetical protein [Sorangium sp. So ce362]|uniref:hypothetical protein n=1 Tax=Sorangium sp. So ce362 TaxID=3133303 RepID=UPI003F5DC38A